MSSINPLAGALAANGQVQTTQASAKERDLRRAEALRRTVAAVRDRVEEEIETTDTVILSEQDEHPDQQRKRKKRRAAAPTTSESQQTDGLDLRA